MIFKFGGVSIERVPSIIKWGFEDLGDDPAKHRWRAWWAGGGAWDDGEAHGIELRAYPVIKTNPFSVWINENGCREATKHPWEDGAPAMEWVPFNPKWMKRRLCHNGALQAWAKPTQDEALRSLAIRLVRWTAAISREQQRAATAITVLEKLCPNWPGYAQTARQNLSATHAKLEEWS